MDDGPPSLGNGPLTLDDGPLSLDAAPPSLDIVLPSLGAVPPFLATVPPSLAMVPPSMMAAGEGSPWGGKLRWVGDLPCWFPTSVQLIPTRPRLDWEIHDHTGARGRDTGHPEGQEELTGTGMCPHPTAPSREGEEPPQPWMFRGLDGAGSSVRMDILEGKHLREHLWGTRQRPLRVQKGSRGSWGQLGQQRGGTGHLQGHVLQRCSGSLTPLAPAVSVLGTAPRPTSPCPKPLSSPATR